MTTIYGYYTCHLAALPAPEMHQLGGNVAPTIEELERGKTWIYSFPDLTIRVSELTDGKLQENLGHLVDYMNFIQQGFPSDQSQKLVGRLKQTKLGIGLEIDGEEHTSDGPTVTEFMRSLAYLTHGIIFNGEVFVDWKGGRILLDTDQTFDPSAEL